VQDRKLVHSDIKPENPPERAAHYLDVPNMPWEATKFPGIKIKVLYTDDTGITTALFKLEPGAVVPLHEHTALEQSYVIEGSLEDHEGKCGPGQFVWRPAGNQHEATAPNGALLLGFFLKHRFAYGEKFFTAPGEQHSQQYRFLLMTLRRSICCTAVRLLLAPSVISRHRSKRSLLG
jgi:quercetin dioxygenase-like cupin family protein